MGDTLPLVALSAKKAFKASAPDRAPEPGTWRQPSGAWSNYDPSFTGPNSQVSQRNASLPGSREPHPHHSYSAMSRT